MNTLETRITNLVKVAAATSTEIPALPTPAEFEAARFSGPPVAELNKRLIDSDGRSNLDRMGTLVRSVGLERSLELIEARVARNPELAEPLARALFQLKLVVADDSLFELLNARSCALATALLHQALETNSYLIEINELVIYALEHELALEWLCSWLDRRHALEGSLSGEALEQLVLAFDAAAANRDLPGLIDLVVPGGRRSIVCRLDRTERQELLADPRSGALLVAVRYGCLLGEELASFAARKGALPIVLAAYPPSGILGDYLRLSVVVAPETLMELPPPAMSWILSHTEIHHLDLLVRAVETTGELKAWLHGGTRYGLNEPSVASVEALCKRGVFTAEHLLELIEGSWGHRGRTWYSAAVANALGLPELYRNLLSGESHREHSSAERLTPYVAEILGDERELWIRLLTGEPGSPFNTPGLSLAEGVAEYHTRWAEAAARSARRAGE